MNDCDYLSVKGVNLMLDLCILGTGGTMPSPHRRLSSCLMRYNGSVLVIDCGEGTQIALKENSFTFKPIDIMCITHYHADHISGLPGMLLSMGNEGREEPLTIIGPPGLERVVNALRVIAPELPFEVRLHEISGKEETLKLGGYKITAFSVSHAVICYGYVVEIDRAGEFDVEKARANGVPLRVWSKLQKESSYLYEDVLYTSDMVLGAPRKGLKVCYCTDTRPLKKIADYARDADVFICEGMYSQDEKHQKAVEAKHMTFKEAATLAREARPKLLVLTHYSPSLPDPQKDIAVAREIFEDSVCGYDGMKFTLNFEHE